MNNNEYGTEDRGKVLLNNEALGLPNGNMKEFKKAASRTQLALFLYLVATYVISFAISLVLAVIAEVLQNEAFHEFASSDTVSIIISSISQYCVGFPLAVLLMALLVKPRVYEKSKLKLGEFFSILAVAEAFMITGSIISNVITGVLGGIFNFVPQDALQTVVDSTPIPLIFLIMVILAPIAEELIFRKLLIDRIGHFGDGAAIIISAVAFALMHTNIFQFFYALFVGLIFGYVYTRTRDVRYSIVMHAVLNFFGSVIAIFAQGAMEKVAELTEIAVNGGAVKPIELAVNLLISSVYTLFCYGIFIAGLVIFIIFMAKRKLVLNESAGTLKLGGSIAKAAIVNVGGILFLALCLIMSVIALFYGG